MKAALLAVAINVALKFALMGSLAQVGLALATALGGWINLGLLIWFARRRGLPVGDGTLPGNLLRLAVCGLALAGVLLGAGPLAARLTAGFAFAREEVIFVLVVGAGGLAYVLSVWALLGRRFLRALARRRAADAVQATREAD
jgi:putative peptidoglycan lipid II flippase